MNESWFKKLEPKSIDDIAGQKHLIGNNCLIRKMIEKKELFSIIFFGLPGTGKTSLAKAICYDLKIDFVVFNPTINNKQDLNNFLKQCIDLPNKKQCILIIDEIHRMNKDKQDILLSHLENGNLTVFATTTENPYFVINPAIRSRCQIMQLQNINQNDIKNHLQKISNQLKITINDDVIELISSNSSGDLRIALNLLNTIHKLYKDEYITKEKLIKILPVVNVIGSSYGNEYYDLQSAFHKSLRGSDIDASIYYLARLIKIGDLNSICRRMIAMAYEDIGLANPSLISRVVLAANSAERLGFPEANQILSTIAIELCLSPKSNSSYKAITKALKDIDSGLGGLEIPNHLKDSHYKSAVKLNVKGYKFPHDYVNNWVEQQYLPKEIINKKYYYPGDNEIENKMNKNLKQRQKKGN